MEQESVPAAPVPLGSADRAVGFALQVFSALGFLVAAVFFSFLRVFIDSMTTTYGAVGSSSPSGPVMQPGADGMLQPTPSQPATTPWLLYFSLGLVFLLPLLMFVSATGIRRSKKRAFGLAIMLATLFCLFGGGITVVAALLLTYCVLRLNAKLGPAPS